MGTEIQPMHDKSGLCPCCSSRSLKKRSKGNECKSCWNWYHLKCGKESDDLIASVIDLIWYCESCCRAKNNKKDTPQVKIFLRYVDDIVRTNKGEPICVLDAANYLNPKLQFTLEETSSEGNLPYLGLNTKALQDIAITCNWCENQQLLGQYWVLEAACHISKSAVLSKALFIELLIGSNLIRLWTRIGCSGWQISTLIIGGRRNLQNHWVQGQAPG